jgi:hypothetical protein
MGLQHIKIFVYATTTYSRVGMGTQINVSRILSLVISDGI